MYRLHSLNVFGNHSFTGVRELFVKEEIPRLSTNRSDFPMLNSSHVSMKVVICIYSIVKKTKWLKHHYCMFSFFQTIRVFTLDFASCLLEKTHTIILLVCFSHVFWPHLAYTKLIYDEYFGAKPAAGKTLLKGFPPSTICLEVIGNLSPHSHSDLW